MAVKTLKSITFVLENCDSITFAYEAIEKVVLNGIGRYIYGFRFCNVVDSMGADEFAIEIRDEADEGYYELGNEKYLRMKFDRLQRWRDITQIELEWDDGKKEVFFPKYTDEKTGNLFSANNANEKTSVTHEGNLRIVIAEGKGIEDFFSH